MSDVACLATGTPFAVLISAFTNVPVIEYLDCAALAEMFKSAHISVVALLETVDNLRLHACVCTTVVTTQIIEISSTTPVTVNNAPVVVAGKDLEAVIAICSPVSRSAAKTTLTHLVPAELSSASVGAVE